MTPAALATMRRFMDAADELATRWTPGSAVSYAAARADFLALIDTLTAVADDAIPTCRETLEIIAGGDGDAQEIARQTLEMHAARRTRTPSPLRPELGALLAASRAIVADMTPEEREAMWQAQREAWVRGNLAIDR